MLERVWTAQASQHLEASKGRDPVFGPELLHGYIRYGERVPVVAEVHFAGRAPLRCAQNLGHVEEPGVAIRYRRHLHAEVELDDHEHQECEAVLPDKAALERTLLDLALGPRVVTREHVTEVVEHHPLRNAALLARNAEAVLRAVLPELAPEGAFGKQAELLVLPGDLRVFADAEHRHHLADPSEALFLVGLGPELPHDAAQHVEPGEELMVAGDAVEHPEARLLH